jgi:hypothetical protein
MLSTVEKHTRRSDRIQRQDQENLSYLFYPLLLKKKILKLTAFIKPDGIHIQA